MDAKVIDWVNRLKSEGFVTFSLNYLSRKGHYSPVSYARQKPQPDTTVLIDKVIELKRSAEGKLAVIALQEAVRQERSSRLREREGGAIKRLSLSKKACSKLSQLSRQTGRTQASVVEGLILEEVEVQKVESLYLKGEREKLKERAEKQEKKGGNLDAREATIQARSIEIATMEEELAVKLRPLETMGKVVDTLRDLDGDNLRIVLRFEPSDSVLPDVVVEADNAEHSALESLRRLCLEVLADLRKDDGENQEQEE
jgi:predicted DNA-binding protein